MGWMWIIVAAWVLLAVGIALLISRSVTMADREAADDGAGPADQPNVVIAPPPLRLAPAPKPTRKTESEPAPARTNRDAPTIPGLPSARPPVGRPPVPRSTQRRRQRRSGSG